MMPAYRGMDSYPYQRNQIPFSHCYHPGIEGVPPQLRGDPSKSPFSYEQFWPYAGSYGHPMPPLPPFCCGHNNFPGYYSYYRPPHPHAHFPPPMYYSGGCPTYSEPFFAPYTSQPHYTMEMPRYEYDKCVPREHHCCGCPNHHINQKEGKSVKIEEQESDVEKKVNDALVPLQLRNHPYPFVWIPPEYTSNRQLKNPTTTEASEQDKISHERKPQGSGNGNSNAVAQPAPEPRVWNGWLPFDFDTKGDPNMVHGGDGIRSLSRENDNNGRECEDENMNQKRQSEPKRSEFPFPIFWLPYYNKQEEGGRTNNQSSDPTPKGVEEAPHTLKSVPVKSHVDEGVGNIKSTSTGDSDVIKKVTNERIIPVKQAELDQGKKDSEGSNKREMDIPVNRMEENVIRKDSHTSGKRRSTSPPKASKLPPVCLRVDPLPRKKNGNGSSRSPSPPASKEHSQCSVHDKAQPNLNHQSTPHTSEKVKPEDRIVQVSENETSETKGAKCEDAHQSRMDSNMASGISMETRESYTDGEKNITENKKEEKGAESMMEEATESNEVKSLSTSIDIGQKEGRGLSDADAAVLIQAAYRGYQVRKWEPLKKLKQIAEVGKEVSDVRGLVQAFEDSSDLQNDDKRKIAIGENIMRLLLKLDTIQGLNPSLRDVRKSLATELVNLQERLDSIMAKKPRQQMQVPVVQESVEVTPLNMQNREYQQQQQQEEVAVPGGSFQGISDENHDTLEKCQDHFCMIDGVNDVRPTGGESESQSPVDPAPNEGIEPYALPNGLTKKDRSSVATADAVNSTNDPSDTDKVVVKHESSDANDIPIDDDKLDTPAWKELPVGVIDEDITDISSGMDEQNEKGSEEPQSAQCTPTMMDGSAMVELPIGLLDEDTVTSVFEKDNVDTSTLKGEEQAENEEYIEELPVGVLDEDSAKFEIEKHDETETCKEVLTAEEKRDADETTRSTTDETLEGTQIEQQLIEEKDRVHSSGESDDWVKIELLNEDKLKGDATLDIGVGQGEGIGDDTESPALAAQVNGHDLGNEDVFLPEPMMLVPVSDSQKEKEPEERLAPEETQVDNPDMVVEKTIGADDEETETLAKEKTELSAAQPALKELPVDEHDGRLNGDMKLLEENEKLRKLMKELMEAGNEQLTVITDLTGRVKDLEKKLARKRRKSVRTRRGRPAASMKSSN